MQSRISCAADAQSMAFLQSSSSSYSRAIFCRRSALSLHRARSPTMRCMEPLRAALVARAAMSRRAATHHRFRSHAFFAQSSMRQRTRWSGCEACSFIERTHISHVSFSAAHRRRHSRRCCSVLGCDSSRSMSLVVRAHSPHSPPNRPIAEDREVEARHESTARREVLIQSVAAAFGVRVPAQCPRGFPPHPPDAYTHARTAFAIFLADSKQ